MDMYEKNIHMFLMISLPELGGRISLIVQEQDGEYMLLMETVYSGIKQHAGRPIPNGLSTRMIQHGFQEAVRAMRKTFHGPVEVHALYPKTPVSLEEVNSFLRDVYAHKAAAHQLN
jgi:hypothetical protein